jgi:hypothetical protein
MENPKNCFGVVTAVSAEGTVATAVARATASVSVRYRRTNIWPPEEASYDIK